jgi:hypothetical protein
MNTKTIINALTQAVNATFIGSNCRDVFNALGQAP